MTKAAFELPGIENIQQFEALFNHATIGIVITNSRGKIINFNQYAETQFGYAKEEVINQSIEILIPRQVRAKHVALRDDFYQHPEPRRMGEGRDLFAQRKDGSNFPVEVSLSNYLINNEIFVIGFVIDITVRKKNEAVVLHQRDELARVTKEITQLNSDLEQKVESRTKMLRETLTALENSKEELSQALENEKELNELKSRFVTTASHEFRTPLSTILSSTFLLEKYNSANEVEKREKHLQYIKDAVADMKSILEDFLSLSKLEEGLLQPKQEIININELVAEVEKIIGEMEHHCKSAQQIIFQYENNFPAYIDKQFFRNILLNLLSNAIKFSNEDGIIKINCIASKEQLIVSVEDNGIGISDEDREHLFERFFRAKNAVNIQGTGLGLHIISKYIELMNGYTEIKSQLNKGTVFTFYIPSKNND
ncbi:MAG: PAS domain-containing sensor histidine kinase [Ferruginibacter sp.]